MTFVFVLLALPATASATLGGSTSLEVLGYDARERAVWMLERDHSEGREPPRLMRLDLHGPRPRVPRPLAWSGGYGDEDDWEREVARRDPWFVALRSRLVPLAAEPDASATIECRGEHARVALAGSAIQPRRVGVRLARTLAPGECEVEVVAVFAIPRSRLSLSIVRYLGRPVEGGYDVDRAVLVRRR